ncbi:CotH kinase family protein [Granulosicoccus sp. 3-233]|uniref:CotH kinase family protein n=1 Tax=Granulosicoccus sp. 3-233 TaxID=3417969 RepID=UPI003D342E13
MSSHYRKHLIRRSGSGSLLRFSVSVCLLLLASLAHAQSQDTEAPVLLLESPSGDNATLQRDFTFSGSVTDTGGSGVRDVRYLLKDLSTGEFISPTGAVESPRVLRTAELSLDNQDAGVWSSDPMTLPEGQYRFYARVRDIAGNSLVWAVRTTFSVVDDVVVDETPPALSLLQPAAGVEVLSDSGQVFSGLADDGNGSGVAQVFYVIKDLSVSAYVDDNGNVESERVLRDANLTSYADGRADWSVSLNLPAGSYRFYASAVDQQNNRNWWAVRRDFEVSESTPPPGGSVFVPHPSDITDPAAFYQQDGYETVSVLRMDVATRTTPGVCTPDDDSGCTLDDVLADIDGDDDFTVDIPVKFIAEDFPDDGLFSNAGLRQRGASSRAAPQKSFRVRLTGDTELWRNEERVQLNKHPYDQSRILNKLSFDLMSTIPHLPSLRTQFVNLWIDDGAGPIDQGLYTHVEAVKKEYLINRGRNRDDNIYKANFFLFSSSDLGEMAVDANGEPVDEARFNSRLEIERGDDHSKVVEMLAALHDPQQSFESVLDRYFNRNNVLTWLTVNLLLGQQDAVTQNYFLYNPLGTEKFYFLPWDYDGSFRTEPQLSQGFDAATLRNRLYWGYARYTDNLFVSRYLQMPGMHQTLMAAAEELYQDYLTPATIRSLTDAYSPLVRPIIGSEPDVSQIGGIRGAENMGVWDARVASLPGIVNSNLQQIRRSPSMPLSHYLKNPIQGGGTITFWWNPAFEVTGTPITYDLQVASTPDFSASTIVVDTSGIADSPDRVESSISQNALPGGTWYYRVLARTSDPELYQVANNRLSEGGQLYIGVRRFSVP